jgi:3'5'-cyclic nucleotide phosphodiesterase
MSRIVTADLVTTEEELKSLLHDHTYGITSDPLTQFACVFSALIHDVDHTGVPNSQLLNENAKLSISYKGRSVAEPHSVDLSWDLLMHDNVKGLRAGSILPRRESDFVNWLTIPLWTWTSWTRT